MSFTTKNDPEKDKPKNPDQNLHDEGNESAEDDRACVHRECLNWPMKNTQQWRQKWPICNNPW